MQSNKRIIIYGVATMLAVSIVGFALQKTTSAQNGLTFDLNQDGTVDEADLTQFRTDFKAGIFDAFDYAAIARDFGLSEVPDDESDYDDDKYTIGEGDCDDRNPAINPIAEEIANGIDDNCNSIIDEFVDYVPLESDEFYHVTMDYQKSDPPTFSNITTEVVQTDQISQGPRTVGEFIVELSDENEEFLDALFFSLPDRAEVNLFSPYEETENTYSTEGSIELYLPKTSDVKHAKIYYTRNPDVLVEIPLPADEEVAFATPASAQEEVINDLCESPFDRFAWRCKGFDLPANQERVKKLATAMELVEDTMPEFAFYKLHSIEFGIESKFTKPPPTMMIAYTTVDNRDIESLASTFAHEKAHSMNYWMNMNFFWDSTIENIKALIFGDTEFRKFIKLVDDQCPADDEDCSFNPREFLLNWPAGDYTPCDGIDCSINAVEEWLDPRNPAKPEELDYYGPRPGEGLGTNRSHGMAHSGERFGVLFESLFLDRIGVSRVITFTISEYPRLKTDQYDTSLRTVIKADPKYPDTSALTADIKLLGHHGFVVDIDHDGVPDEYDNCAPLIACSEDAENNYESCSNPDQRDEVDSENETPEKRDPLGDRCEEGRNMAFCGSVPGSYEDYDAVPDKYKNRVRWVTPEVVENNRICFRYLMGTQGIFEDADTLGEAGCALPGLSNGVESPLGSGSTCERGGRPKYSRFDGPCGGTIGNYCERAVAGRCSYTGNICKKNEDCQELENTENTCRNFSIDGDYSVHGANNYE